MSSVPRAAAVVVDAGKVLIIRRYLRLAKSADCVMCEYAAVPGWRRGESRCDGHRYAVLPGGHVEPGESAASAALRELQEETTLAGSIDQLLWTGTHNGRPSYYFRVTDVSGVPRLSGDEAAAHCATNHFELAWAAAGELNRAGIYPHDLEPRLRRLLEPRDHAS